MTLYCTHGLPRSGKTTFTRQWKMREPNRVVVSGDDIRLAIFGQRFNPKIEDYVQAVKKTMISALLLSDTDVMHEGTNTTMKSIKEMESIAKEYGVPLVWIMFETPIDECIRRAIATNQEDLIEPIKRMDEQRKESAEYLIKKYSDDGHWIMGKNSAIVDFCGYRTGNDKTAISITNRCGDQGTKITSLIKVVY